MLRPAMASETATPDRSESSGPDPAPLPGAGTPEGEALRKAHRAFELGDFRKVRELCAPLSDAPDPSVASAAADLSRRVSVDPVQLAVLGLCLVVFSFIVYVYVLGP